MMSIIPPAYDHCVYLLSRRDHVIIYVGVTSNLFARLGSHAETKPWWQEVALIQVESFETRKIADMRENQLISTLEPFYNVVGSEQGTTRHLSELRLATLAIRRARNMAVAHPQHPLVNVVPTCSQPAGKGVTLAEALPLIQGLRGRQLSLDGLRTAAGRPGFPVPLGRRGKGQTAPKVYDLDELRSWRTREA